MESLLCHACYERNDENITKCEFCGAILKENQNEQIVEDLIKNLTKAAMRVRVKNYPEYYILIVITLFLAIHLFYFGFALSSWDIDHVIQMDITWFEFSFYALSFLMMISAIRLLRRNKGSIKLMTFLIPIQLILQAKFLYFVKTQVISSYRPVSIFPIWTDNIQLMQLGITIYSLILGMMYSAQTYLLIFNYRVRRCLH